jgi:hypothetical protein
VVARDLRYDYWLSKAYALKGRGPKARALAQSMLRWEGRRELARGRNAGAERLAGTSRNVEAVSSDSDVFEQTEGTQMERHAVV